MKKLLASVSLALFCLFSHAQSAPPTGQDSCIFPSSTLNWNQPLTETPFRTVTIDGPVIEVLNPQSAVDLLGATGEVFVQKNSPGGGIPLTRGFATNRQMFMIDGIRLTTAVSLSSNLQNVLALDPFYLDNAEIRFGPGSVQEGSDAIGGIFSFETLKPSFSNSSKINLGGNALTRFSSANREYSGHVDFSAGWKKLAFITSITQCNFGDIRMGRKGPDEYLDNFYVERAGSTDVSVSNPDPMIQHPTGYSRTNILQKIQFAPDENWVVSYGFYLSRTSETPHFDKLLATRDGVPMMAESYYGPQTWMMNHLSASYIWPSTLCDRLGLSVAHQYFKDSRTDRYFNDPIRFHREEVISSYTINVDMVKCIRQGHQLTYGLEIIYDNIRSEGTDENILTGEMVPGPGSYAQTGWGSYGIYANYTFWINSKLNISAGARYNLFLLDASFDTNFYNLPFAATYANNDGMTGSAGFVYRPNDKWLLNGNFSTGLRAPNADDIGRLLDSEPGSVVVPNPELKSEYAINLEIGASRIVGEFVKTYLSAYTTYLDRAFVCRDYVLDSRDSILFDGEMNRVQAIQNASHAWIFGFQAGFDAVLPFGLGMNSRINFQHGTEILSGGSTSPIPHAAPFFGKVALSYSRSKIESELYTNFSAKVDYADLPQEELDRAYLYALDNNGNPYAPTWFTLNFKATYRINRHLAASGGIENITGERYRPYGSGITAPGMNFIVSLKAGF